jgi:hypothetical protein
MAWYLVKAQGQLYLDAILHGHVDWIHLVQNRDQYRPIVKANEPWTSAKDRKYFE